MPARQIIVSAIAMSVLVACSSSGAKDAQLFDEVPRSITVNAVKGDVRVNTSTLGSNSVTAEVTEGEPEWTAQLIDGVIVVDDGCAESAECGVNFTILIDQGADVTVISGAGGVTVSGVNAAVSVTNASGNVSLTGITGPIDIKTTEGDISAARLVVTDASFVTESGSVDVTIEETFDSLTVMSGNGDVTAQVPNGAYAIAARTGSGNLDINVTNDDSANVPITIATERGDVTVYRR